MSWQIVYARHAQKDAQKLAASAVAVSHHCADDMIHAYLLLESLVPEACDRAYAQMAAFVAA